MKSCRGLVLKRGARETGKVERLELKEEACIERACRNVGTTTKEVANDETVA
jgi:hypothetical protein